MTNAICIPSYCRSDLKQARTLKFLAKFPQPDYSIYLVVRAEQSKSYQELVNSLNLGDSCQLVVTGDSGIVEARNSGIKAARKNGVANLLFCDDDLSFSARIGESLLTITKQSQSNMMFDSVFGMLTDYAHVAVSTRLANRDPKKLLKTGVRGHTCVGYDLGVLKAEKLLFATEAQGKEGLDMTLRLFERGYTNAVTYAYSINSCGKSVAESDQYGPSLQAAEALMKRHPEVVTLEEKDYKMGKRVEVRINWKKALKVLF